MLAAACSCNVKLQEGENRADDHALHAIHDCPRLLDRLDRESAARELCTRADDVRAVNLST